MSKPGIDFRGALNDQQYKVVTEGDGHCLVLAGAGSGKTRTLIYRLAYLLENGTPPENILLMTFTNKAAREMRERTEILLGYKPAGLWSGTFHHIGNRFLRKYAPEVGFKRDFGILDQHDSRDLVKACLKKFKYAVGEKKFPKPSVLQSIISLSENTGKTIAKVLEQRYSYFEEFSKEIDNIKNLYHEKKEESGTMDYDDLLSKWKWMLENVPVVKNRFSSQFKYIMVDEYQDTNYIQSEIIDLLGSGHGNILAVGDDAQSIYSFRGALVENILKFPKKFEGSKTFKLETNYRSSPEILTLANDSLVNNDDQFEKELKAVNPSMEKPVLVEVNDMYSQAKFVAGRISALNQIGVKLDDIAVLFRAHYQSAELEMELVKQGVPYIVRGGIRFFEQAHIKDVLSYLKIAINPIDELSWIRALSMYPGIGPGYAGKIYALFRKSGMELARFVRDDLSGAIPQKAREGYASFRAAMRNITPEGENLTAAVMIENILEWGYKSYARSIFENASDRIDDIHELMNFSHEYGTVNDFLNDITLREDFRGEAGEQEGKQLILSTIHQAKGLEWSAVIIIGLCEGQFPNHKALGEKSGLEEERRLFYVAVTRAKKYLYMMHPQTRYDYNLGTIAAERSRFLEELYTDDYELQEWEGGRYSYKTYGEDLDTIEL